MRVAPFNYKAFGNVLDTLIAIFIKVLYEHAEETLDYL